MFRLSKYCRMTGPLCQQPRCWTRCGTYFYFVFAGVCKLDPKAAWLPHFPLINMEPGTAPLITPLAPTPRSSPSFRELGNLGTRFRTLHSQFLAAIFCCTDVLLPSRTSKSCVSSPIGILSLPYCVYASPHTQLPPIRRETRQHRYLASTNRQPPPDQHSPGCVTVSSVVYGQFPAINRPRCLEQILSRLDRMLHHRRCWLDTEGTSSCASI